jgi:hypothetical protein
MKLRCAHNSIRLRLGKSDIQSLESVYEISESISFGGSVKLSYLLYTAEIDSIRAELKDNVIAIGLPLTKATEWITSEQVGIEHTISFSNGTNLHVLIEKDFPCKDTPVEEQEDTFIELVPPDRDMC